jgi:hypothetical protein
MSLQGGRILDRLVGAFGLLIAVALACVAWNSERRFVVRSGETNMAVWTIADGTRSFLKSEGIDKDRYLDHIRRRARNTQDEYARHLAEQYIRNVQEDDGPDREPDRRHHDPRIRRE